MEELINIVWLGPFNLKKICDFNDADSDYGIYQIYGHHPVYGRALAYIGKAREQTFAVRVPQHKWGSGSENDPNQIEVYVGRLVGTTPDLETWRHQIDLAEKLLIHSHAPAYNTKHIYEAPSASDCAHVRILNWAACRSLAREVSGLMWTSEGTRLRDQPIYRASEMSRLPEPN
jgi:hypothetical protein